MSSILFYSTRKSKIFGKKISKKIHTQKNGPCGAPGPASASPWRAKVSQCRKTERGDPLRYFNIHSVAKHEKIEEKKIYFREKISQCRKKLKGGTLWDFQDPFCSKTSKKCRGPFGERNSEKKCLAVPKKLKGGTLWSRPVCTSKKHGMLRGKTGKTILVQFARPNGAI